MLKETQYDTNTLISSPKYSCPGFQSQRLDNSTYQRNVDDNEQLENLFNDLIIDYNDQTDDE